MASLNQRNPSEPAATGLSPVDAMRRRARHRLIGASVLVVLGVILFPMLFDSQPRAVSPSMPIVVNGKADVVAVGASAAGADHGLSEGEEVVETAAVKTAKMASHSAQPAMAVAPTIESDQAAAQKAAAAEKAAADKAAADKLAAERKAAADKAAADKAKQEAARKAAADKAAADKAKQEAARKAAEAEKAKQEAARKAAAEKATAAEESKPDYNFPDKGRFVVQVGAYVANDKVAGVRSKLSAAGLNNFTQKVTIEGKEVTRVRMGPFSTRKEMERVAAKVRSLGLPVQQLSY